MVPKPEDLHPAQRNLPVETEKGTVTLFDYCTVYHRVLAERTAHWARAFPWTPEKTFLTSGVGWPD